MSAATGITVSKIGTRGRIAAILLWLCALAAAVAAASALPVVLTATGATQFVEAWRLVGFATFAAMFAVTAYAPRRVPPGIWVAVIANKLVLTVVGIAWATTVDGAASAVVWDGSLTVLLVVAFGLTRARR